MTRDERTHLFAGVSTPVRAAISLDGNGRKFEQLWDTVDPDEFFARLNDFAKGLGLSAYGFYPDQSPKLTALIAADVDLVTQRIGWWWAHDRAQPKGNA